MPDSALPADLPRDLRYVDDTQPGIRRKKRRGTFQYFDAQGERITDANEITRLNALAVPPAYTDVWICADPRGHLQATGRDARGRKQYRYHPRWREVRDTDKYSRLQAFGNALPTLRKQLEAQLAEPGFTREKVLATVVMLLDATLIRVGNTQYARDNKSYGLTTLRNRHVDINGSEIQFQFRGKSGVEHQVSVKDRRLATVVRRCLELPGQNLFQYLDEDGEQRHVSSGDVNDYLREATGGEFTAKDFRTWHGSVQALELTRLACDRQVEESTGLRVRAKEILAAVARQLGNTPAVCRKAYIHPAVLALGGKLSADAEAMSKVWDGLGTARTRRGLLAAEGRLMDFLRHHRLAVAREARQLKRVSSTARPRRARS